MTFAPRPSGGIFDPVEIAFVEFSPSAATGYSGFFSENSSFQKGDPEITSLLKRARGEFEEKRRQSLMHEFQRMEADNQYQPSFVAVADTLAVNWPVIQNYAVFPGELPFVGLWLDPEKPPLKTS